MNIILQISHELTNDNKCRQQRQSQIISYDILLQKVELNVSQTIDRTHSSYGGKKRKNDYKLVKRSKHKLSL